MIYIADLRDRHKGKKVMYKAYRLSRPEFGTISSWNNRFVFVKFSRLDDDEPEYGVACSPQHLYWLSHRTFINICREVRELSDPSLDKQERKYRVRETLINIINI